MWAMDVKHLQQLTEKTLAKNLHLFEIDPAKLPRRWWRGWYGGQDAYINYYLKDAQEVKLEIKDQSGKTIRELKGTGDAGLNLAVWDLKPEKVEKKKDEKPKSPYVEPGKYKVVIKAGSFSQEGLIEVKK
jgi:hypothetical protein